MCGRLVRSLAILISLSVHAAAAQPLEGCKNGRPSASSDSYYWSGAALPVEVMREYLDMRWSQRAIETADPFPVHEMLAAIAAVKDRTPPRGDFLPYESYVPPGGPQPPFEYAYDEAAGHYRARDFATAIPLFDAIAADRLSPYRAAAAYSAARAALLLGRYEEGIRRLDRLVDDPQKVEFRSAALKVVGTLQYQHGGAPLIAARFAQIAYLLSAPPFLECRYPPLAPVITEALDDLSWLQNQKSADPREAQNDPPISHVMDKLSLQVAFIDLLRVTGAPTPYAQDYGWTDEVSFIGLPESGLRGRMEYRAHYPTEAGRFDPAPVVAQAKELTAHARARWQETKNPLWAHALAARSADVADVTIIREALAALPTEPKTPEARLSNLFLRRHLVAQGARILLMAGRADDAITLLHDELAVVKRISQIQFPGWYSGSGNSRWSTSFVLNGGVRWLLQRRDLDGARRWADKASEVLNDDAQLYGLKLRPDAQLEVLLARNPKELVLATLAEGRLSYGSGEALSAVADLLPAKTLIEMSAEKQVAPEIRRALLAAGWSRLYLLGRTEEALALMPRVRELFPELAGDVDAITGAWFSTTRDHAITRMLLRSPGFVPRVRYFRRDRQSAGIFAIDSANPSDGNWWCPLDLDLIKSEMLFGYRTFPLREPQRIAWYAPYFRLSQSNHASQTAEADQLIAWHPLFKAMDKSELEALAHVENGPKLLTERAVSWASWSNWFTWALGWDNDLPETLHLAVRSTRYGCRRNGPHGAYSRAAFEYLHDHYPSSEWTKKTPFWFDKPKTF